MRSNRSKWGNGLFRIHSHDLAREPDHGEFASLAVVKSARNHLDVDIDAGIFLVRNIDEIADTWNRALIAYLDMWRIRDRPALARTQPVSSLFPVKCEADSDINAMINDQGVGL